jgi:hypothetical protein
LHNASGRHYGESVSIKNGSLDMIPRRINTNLCEPRQLEANLPSLCLGHKPSIRKRRSTKRDSTNQGNEQ